jgi:L-fuculose-phosphate aldolase
MVKSGVRAGDMVGVTLAGKRRSGRRNPTSELDLHLRILRCRSDVGAVVHAHPPAATAFAVAGLDLTSFALAELILLVGPVPLVPYATPGSAELGVRVAGFIERHDALLLANHGAVTVGRTLDEAWNRMESLEHAARILSGARQLGRVTELETEAVDRLMQLRERGRGRDV